MIINHISNTKYNEQSGGGSGVNAATIQQLTRFFKVNLIDPIYPPTDFISKLKSVALRKLYLKGNYHFFSENRLQKIEQEFQKLFTYTKADVCFFHGFTPWIKTSPDIPYFCFNDASFATYVEIYNNPNEFSTNDLQRIFKQEALWLQKAKRVFFRSNWALEETIRHYNINGDNFKNVGVGGFIDIPTKDTYSGGFNFLFISREFIPKGGLVVSEAIKKVRIKYPSAKLWIVGQCPPKKILNSEGIEYKGFFNKTIPDEKKQLINLFSKVFSLVHPTVKDTNTLVINELAYHGCPAIASNRFAIPEYLLDGKTGFLLDNPKSADELADKMCLMIKKTENYQSLRTNARRNALTYNTWDKVGERIANEINQSLK
jgi:glycosyltransferase involved in cell wall biosynthesis